MFSSLLKSSVTLAKGSAISSLILIAITPLVTRYYSPDDFAYYGLVVSISSVVSVGLFFRFELSLADRKNYEHGGYFLGAFLVISIPLSILLSCVVYFILNLTEEWQRDSFRISIFVLICSWSFSAFYLATILCSSKWEHQYINRAKIWRNIHIAFFQICLGLINPSFIALAASDFLGRIYSTIYLFCKSNLKVKFSSKYLKVLLIRNVEYLKYSFPAAFINSSTINILPIIYPILYGTSSAGLVVLVTRIVGVPLSLIGQSLSTSYIGYVSSKDNRDNYKAVRTSLHKLVKILSLTSLLLFLLIFFVLEYFGEYIFGKEWFGLGGIFVILSPALYFQVVFSSFSQSLNIFGLQRFQLIWDVCRLILVSFSICLPSLFYVDYSAEFSLILYSFSMSVMYLIQYVYFVYFLRSKEVEALS